MADHDVTAAMAAPMQHMAGPAQMMQQQPRGRLSPAQLQQVVYANLLQNPHMGFQNGWQLQVPVTERLAKTLNL